MTQTEINRRIQDLYTEKLAAMMANAHEGEKYNQLTKEWEKI